MISHKYVQTFESFIFERFKPERDKIFPRCVDFRIYFTGGIGETKKDFETAKNMIDSYCKANKIKQKPVYATPQDSDSDKYRVRLNIDKGSTGIFPRPGSKTDDYDMGIDLQPLYVELSKLKTAEEQNSSHVALSNK